MVRINLTQLKKIKGFKGLEKEPVKAPAQKPRRWTYYLEGDIPSKKNSKQVFKNKSKKTGKVKFFPSTSNRFKLWDALAKRQIAPQDRPEKPILATKYVCITIYYSTRRATDLTNTAEGIMDLLVSMKILKDDNYKVVPRLYLIGEYRKGFGGAKIIVRQK